MKRLLILAAACLLPNLSGCAWTDPDRRIVFDAFEESLIPEEDSWFYATLPLTIPGGLLAIATDILVVGPVIAADEAAASAGEQWEDIDWKQDYVSEVAYSPLRAASTAGDFAVQWAFRSVFRSSDPRDEEQEQAEYEAEVAERQRQRDAANEEAIAILEGLLRDPDSTLPPLETLRRAVWNERWTDELSQILGDRFQELDPARRYWFLRAASLAWLGTSFDERIAWTKDPDDSIRLALIAEARGSGFGDTAARLLQKDPNPLVRAIALDILEEQRQMLERQREERERRERERNR